MNALALSTKDIVFDLKVRRPLEEVWGLWVDPKALERWLTVEANVRAELGGEYELFWNPATRHENSTLGCKITAFVLHQTLGFEWRGPVPFADLMNVKPFPTSVAVSFEALDENATLIHFRHSGWGVGERWDAAREWQKNAWTAAFSELT